MLGPEANLNIKLLTEERLILQLFEETANDATPIDSAPSTCWHPGVIVLLVERRALQWTTLVCVDGTNINRPNTSQKRFIDIVMELSFLPKISILNMLLIVLSQKTGLLAYWFVVGDSCKCCSYSTYLYKNLLVCVFFFWVKIRTCLFVKDGEGLCEVGSSQQDRFDFCYALPFVFLTVLFVASIRDKFVVENL